MTTSDHGTTDDDNDDDDVDDDEIRLQNSNYPSVKLCKCYDWP